jgi:hypothetical protein
MAIISTLSSKTTLPMSYCLKRNVWRTSISSSHDYVCLYFVYHSIEPEGTQMMCFLFECRPDSILNKPLYYSAWRPRDFWSSCVIRQHSNLCIALPLNTVLWALNLVSEWTRIPQIFSTAGLWSLSEPKSRGFSSRPRYIGLGVNPNPADFLNRMILVSECWTRIPRIFSTAGFWSRSEPESRGFSQPRDFGLGVNPNPADSLNRGILV